MSSIPLLGDLALSASALGFVAPAANSPRADIDFDRGWRFCPGDFIDAMMPGFDDSAWQRVNVPHDWSIDGPFGPQYSSGNGYAPGGIGWYRKQFILDPSLQGKRVDIQFDGVYDNSDVWINGQFVGRRPYGYISFAYDLTQFLSFGQENVLSVRVDHSRVSDSRWYTGSGIYRHVRLHLTSPLHIATWGTAITTPAITSRSARVRIETTVDNEQPSAQTCTLQTDLVDPEGRVVATQSSAATIPAGGSAPIVQQLRVEHPLLWSHETPACYTAHSRVLIGSVVKDESITTFGVRTLKFDPNQGILLNGHAIKLKGVCLHHDGGTLGAAVPDGVWERRLRLLKDMGVNSIRTSHNPPAPELLDLCDRLGLMVMDEAFDEFTPSKNKWVTGWTLGQPSKFGYGESFNEWSIRDIQDMVRRDRNHPSVIIWSIGNEVDTPNDPFSHPVLGERYQPQNPPAENLITLARPLIAAIKKLDRSRPVTAALADIVMSDAVGFGEILDIVGYNYKESHYPADHITYPGRVIYGSENGHSYADWAVVRDTPYVGGQFLWTGIDYLGESHGWPARANGSGLLDLCGFKKPMAWFRESLWSDQPVVYACASSAPSSTSTQRQQPEERWDWPDGRTVSVACYTNCPEVRLTLNGKELGTKELSAAVDGVLTWPVPYASGTLRAEGLRNGKVAASFVLQTPGPAARIELLPDMTALRANSKDICHVEFFIVDANGVRIAGAAPEVTFTIVGPAVVLGIGNGNLSDLQPGNSLNHHAYQGRGLAILQSTADAGSITLTATAVGLSPAAITLTSK